MTALKKILGGSSFPKQGFLSKIDPNKGNWE